MNLPTQAAHLWPDPTQLAKHSENELRSQQESSKQQSKGAGDETNLQTLPASRFAGSSDLNWSVSIKVKIPKQFSWAWVTPGTPPHNNPRGSHRKNLTNTSLPEKRQQASAPQGRGSRIMWQACQELLHAHTSKQLQTPRPVEKQEPQKPQHAKSIIRPLFLAKSVLHLKKQSPKYTSWDRAK